MHPYQINLRFIAAVIVTLATSALSLFAGERQESLQAALKGADRVTVRDVKFGLQEKPKKLFEFSEPAKIADLISSLVFDDDQSGVECKCLGDAIVTFFEGGKKLAELSHHHGSSLRWNGGKWEGDSLFTVEAAKAWREWFNAQGEPRFERMNQHALAEAKHEREIHDRFMRAFRPEAGAIFSASGRDGWNTFSPQKSSKAGDAELSPSAKKLIALYPDRRELAIALAKALGSLAISGADEGSWSTSSARERLVLECSKSLKTDTFREVLESEDEEVLAGAARLFFFERLAKLLPEEQRAQYAAKLAKVVLQRDKCDNADMAVRALGRLPSPETIALLEDLAAGKIRTENRSSDYKDEPSPRSAACLFLGKFGSKKVGDLSTAIEQGGGVDNIDQAALRIARSFSGERGLLNRSIFEIDSFTIGFGALAALEREGGKSALDAIIMGGTEHRWAAICKEAVLTAERMTGRTWENKRAKWPCEDVREWWQKNRDSYVLPKTETNKALE